MLDLQRLGAVVLYLLGYGLIVADLNSTVNRRARYNIDLE